MKILKGWMASGYPIYWIVYESEIKCIDQIVNGEYVIVNTTMQLDYLQVFEETSWLDLLVVTGITKEQVIKVFREDPELRTSYARPRPTKEQ